MVNNSLKPFCSPVVATQSFFNLSRDWNSPEKNHRLLHSNQLSFFLTTLTCVCSAVCWRGGHHKGNRKLLMFYWLTQHKMTSRVYPLDGWYWYEKWPFSFSIKIIWDPSSSTRLIIQWRILAFPRCCQCAPALAKWWSWLFSIGKQDKMTAGLCKKTCNDQKKKFDYQSVTAKLGLPQESKSNHFFFLFLPVLKMDRWLT